MDGKRFIANVKGVGVKGVAREFYMSAKSDELTGGSWSTEIPNLGNNKYLWYRDKFALTNGTVATTTPICDGAWEAIYNIYDINKNIASYVADVEALKSEVQPITRGGTGATSVATARLALGIDNDYTKLSPADVESDEYYAWEKAGNGFMTFGGYSDSQYSQIAIPDQDASGVLVNYLNGWEGQIVGGSWCKIYQLFLSDTGVWYRKINYSQTGIWKKLSFGKTPISLTRNTSNTPSDSTDSCYYVESEQRVYFRGCVATRNTKVYKSGEANVLWTVPESYRPPTRYALAVSNGGGVVGQAYIGSGGEITLIARGGNIGTENLIYITGWWDTEIMTN